MTGKAGAATTRPTRHQKPPRNQLKGWRKPPGSLVVTRPARWSNPYRVTSSCARAEAVAAFRRDLLAGQLVTAPGRPPLGVSECRRDLAGLDLVCSCPLDGLPCHADVLIEVANSSTDLSIRAAISALDQGEDSE